MDRGVQRHRRRRGWRPRTVGIDHRVWYSGQLGCQCSLYGCATARFSSAQLRRRGRHRPVRCNRDRPRRPQRRATYFCGQGAIGRERRLRPRLVGSANRGGVRIQAQHGNQQRGRPRQPPAVGGRFGLGNRLVFERNQDLPFAKSSAQSDAAVYERQRIRTAWVRRQSATRSLAATRTHARLPAVADRRGPSRTVAVGASGSISQSSNSCFSNSCARSAADPAAIPAPVAQCERVSGAAFV